MVKIKFVYLHTRDKTRDKMSYELILVLGTNLLNPSNTLYIYRESTVLIVIFCLLSYKYATRVTHVTLQKLYRTMIIMQQITVIMQRKQFLSLIRFN